MRARDGVDYVDAETRPFEDVRNLVQGTRGQGHDDQNAFTDYFIGKGAVSFQKNCMY